MIALVIGSLLCFGLVLVVWIADRTAPDEPEVVLPFRQPSHVALTDLPCTKDTGDVA